MLLCVAWCCARVVELVYTADLKSASVRIVGSNPASRTKLSCTLFVDEHDTVSSCTNRDVALQKAHHGSLSLGCGVARKHCGFTRPMARNIKKQFVPENYLIRKHVLMVMRNWRKNNIPKDEVDNNLKWDERQPCIFLKTSFVSNLQITKWFLL